MIDEKRLIGTLREKWKGIETGDRIGRGWCLAMNRKRERKFDVAIDIILIYEREIVTL